MNVSIHSKSKFSSQKLRRRNAGWPTLLMLAALPVTLRAQSTWDVTNGDWNTALNWLPGLVPVSDVATQLVFNASGSTSYTTTNNIGSSTFTLNRLTVNNTGIGTVTIAGAANANTLTFGGTTPTLDITGNVLFLGLLAGNNTITKTGAGTFIHDSNNGGFTGTLVVDQGTFINRSTNLAATNFNPVSIVVNNGATYQFGENGTGDPNLPNSTYITVNTGGTVVWQEGEAFGGFHLKGGTINLQAGPSSGGSTVQSWTSGTVTGGSFVVGGATAINKTTADTVNITGSVAVNPTNGLNILDGAIAMANAANLGTANITLGSANGSTMGTFEYRGSTATRGAGNFTTNAGGGVIKITTPTTTLTLNGSLFGSGAFTKTGPGRLRLTGFLGNTGSITAAEGVLQMEPTFASGAIVIGDGGVLAINSGDGLFSFNAPTLHFAGSGSTLQFDLNTNALTATPLAIVAGFEGLTLTGMPTLKLTNLQPFANGTYTLIDYEGNPVAANFNLVLPGRTTGTLIQDFANTKLDVEISGTDTVKWTGANGSHWDAGTAPGVGGTPNWKLAAAGGSTNFYDSDTVTFDDSSPVHAVELTTKVQPFSVTVDAAADYTFSGTGSISGATALHKAGTGTLILNTDNDYTGGTTITGGTVQLSSGGTTGSILGAVTLNGGTLAFNRSDNLIFGSPITVAGTAGLLQNGTGTVTIPTPFAVDVNTVTLGGSGHLTMSATVSGTGIINKEGAGTLTLLANSNAFTGTLNVNGGTVLLNDLGSGGDFGASSIVINNGGSFIFGSNGNVDFPDATFITINTGGLFRLDQGENFGGYILNGGEFRHVNANSTAITIATGSTVYDLRSGSITTDSPASTGALNQGGGGVLTKTTTGTVTVSGGVTFQTTLGIEIKEGVLAMNPNNVPATGNAPITFGSATTSGTWQINGSGTATTSRSFTVQDGGGVVNVVDPATVLTMTGFGTGNGALTKTGNGTLVLTLPNTFLGGTTVLAGTLEANNTVDSATGVGPLLVEGTLSGDGGIAVGAFDVTINGTFRVGASTSIQGTDFHILAANTNFGPASVARFDLWSTTGSDQSFDFNAADLLHVTGSLNISAGATLRLSNPNGLAFQAGDVFQVLDLAGTSSVAGNWAIDFADLNLGNLTVDTSSLHTLGTIAIVVPEPGSAVLVMLGLGLMVSRRGARRR